MRMLSLDKTISGSRLVNFSVWNGIAAPEGHIKLVIKVTLPPEKGMMGASKYHREDIKWNGTDKNLRENIIAFLSRNKDKDFDVKAAMYHIRNLFI